jgi:hypothetical protein
VSDNLLDVLRAIARRRASRTGEIEHAVERDYEKNEKTHQIVEFSHLSPLKATPRGEPQTVFAPATVSQPKEFCGSIATDRIYRGYEKNEINEKIKGRISSPDQWVAAFSALPLPRAPGDVPLRRWRQFVGNARRLLEDGTLDEAVRLGWTTLDLFGCDESKPFARVDQMGLIWFIQGDHLVSMSSSAAIIETVSGARLTYRRKTEGAGQVAVWKLFSAGGGDAKAIDVAREED